MTPDKLNAVVFGGFAAVALLISVVGVAGVLAFSVSGRTREFGIRMALGAQRREVVRVTLADGLTPVLIGLLAGLVGGAALIQSVRSMLYGMSPFDWSVFATVVLVITITAALASIFPAWRATRLDPSQALRAE